GTASRRAARPQGAGARSSEMLVDELDDPLDRAAARVRHRLLADVALSLAFEQLEIDLPAGLAVLADEAVEGGAGMRLVVGALKINRRRHLDALTALERDDGAALGHRLFRLPVLIVAGQHAIDDLGVRLAAGLEAFRVPISAERIDHRPAHHDRLCARIDTRRAGWERNRRVAGIARAHGREHRLLASAGRAHEADAVRAAAQRARAALEPADRVVDVGHARRVRAVGRHAEVDGGHDHAALRERLVDHRVLETIFADPRAAVDF